MSGRYDHLAAQIQAMICEGRTYTEIAARFGFNRSQICKMKNRGLLDLSNVRRRGRPAIGCSALVPKWVPRDLWSDYHDNTRLYGEQRAARIVSAMKAEAMRPEI